MSRRYLTIEEAEACLSRGKEVEVFLGGFIHSSNKCIRWASFSKTNEGITAKLWEALDEGSPDYLDIYTFNSLNDDYIEPVKELHESGLENAINQLNISNTNFVNQ